MTAIVQYERKSVLAAVASRYDMEPQAFEATLRGTIMKQASKEELAAFLVVANEYELNPLTKEIFAFPAKGGSITPVVSVDGWARIINSHPMFDGMTFVDALDSNGKLVSITCRMHRKDRSQPIEATEYMAECARSTDVWRTWPRRMLRHKALIQAARYAFGFAGIYDEDEAIRIAAADARQFQNEAAVPLSQRLAASGAAAGSRIIDHVESELSGEVARKAKPGPQPERSEMGTLDAACADGQAAALGNLSRTDCPDSLTADERDAWLAGFDAADAERDALEMDAS